MPSETGARHPVTVADLSERELISRIQAHLPPPPDWMLLGIGDDAAIVEPERNRAEVLTVDALVEGVHFDRRFTPPDAIGHRALAVNLSDLAAMGATPRLALLSFALPPSLTCDEFEAMVRGLTTLAARYKVQVAGGNLTRSPGPLMLDITVIGSVKPRQALKRAGARPGDDVYVTGTIGTATAGLQMLKSGLQPPFASLTCVSRYLYPEPRVLAGTLLGRNRAATACLDLSDGLADGVHQIAHANGIGLLIDAALVPVDAEARAWFDAHGGDATRQAITGGDDYELMFTASPKQRGRLRAVATRGGVPLSRIGVCTPDGGGVLRRVEGDRIVDDPLAGGYTHFR